MRLLQRHDARSGNSGWKYICFIIAFIWFSAQAYAEPCAVSVEDALDTMMPGDLITICDSLQQPWEILLKSNERRDVGSFQGTPLTLFNFREETWSKGEPNNLSIQLTQLTDHVWRVDFILDGIIQKTDDRQQQFIWARDTQQVPRDRGFFNETDVKYFHCLVLDETMCRTTYNAVVCRDYQSDNFARQGFPREEPGFIVSAKAKKTPVELLETFEMVNFRMDRLLEEITKHSCRKGWIKHD